jgi:hypothetical protein
MKRLGLALLASTLALSGCGNQHQPSVSKAVRAKGLTFKDVTPQDRKWIEEALHEARPEAASLIDDVDGMVTITTGSFPGARWVGLTHQYAPHAYAIQFNLAYLNGDRTQDRNVTVLHELGHVIDFALTPPQLRDQLAASLPPVGACVQEHSGDCTAPEERFADTFAKWALRGAVSLAGAGYGVASPASLEDWGAPLSKLAIEIDVASRA